MRSVLVLLAGLAVLVGCSKSSTQSFKYVRAQDPIPPGRTNLTPEEESVERLLQEAVKIPVAVEYFGKILHSAVIVVRDLNDLTFTVRLENGQGRVIQGTDTTVEPDYVVPLRRQNVENLLKILQDGKIDDEESYRIQYMTYVPGLKAMFRAAPLYNEWVAKQLALPNLMHMTLKNEKNYVFQGSTREVSATVANVNGQWLVFEGLQGDPDWKLTATQDQIRAMVTMVKEPVTITEPKTALKRIGDVKATLDAMTVYRRAK